MDFIYYRHGSKVLPTRPHSNSQQPTRTMLRFDNANSYATRNNAIAKLTKVCGERLCEYHWVIIAQEDGRFSPLVMLSEDQAGEAFIFANSGICVRD